MIDEIKEIDARSDATHIMIKYNANKEVNHKVPTEQ